MSLMICPKANECGFDGCVHKTKHINMSFLCKHPNFRVRANDFDCPACIPYEPEFKAGDRVDVIGKSVGYSFEKWKKIFSSKYADKDGHFEIIKIIGDGSGKDENNCILIGYSYFAPQDLKPIKEDGMGYKILKKELLLSDLAKKAREHEVVNFLENYIKTGAPCCFALQNPDYPIPVDSRLIQYASGYPCFIKFLVEDGYIAPEKSDYDKWVDECPLDVSPPADRHALIEWAKRMPKE